VSTSRRSLRRRLALAVAAILAACVGASLVVAVGLPSGTDTAKRADAAVPVRPAPELVGTTLDGEDFDLERLRGSFVLVNLWATWCAACREEMPLLVDAVRRPALRGVELVGVDVRDPAVAARRFLADLGAEDTTHVMDPDGRTAVAWGARGVPQTFLVDPEGRVVAANPGPVDVAWLTDVVVPLVEGR
jgi:cytochrome c biogenesis protein CcmG, thiol:disulfide interchange protein DsbE